jgi:hypothetical protein
MNLVLRRKLRFGRESHPLSHSNLLVIPCHFLTIDQNTASMEDNRRGPRISTIISHFTLPRYRQIRHTSQRIGERFQNIENDWCYWDKWNGEGPSNRIFASL